MPACPIPAIGAQYEVLRIAVLGAALPPNARGGLMLFLHRGMWGWAGRVSSYATDHSQSPSLTPSVPRNGARSSFTCSPPWL